MFYRTKSGVTLTKQSTIWKHYGIIAVLIFLFGFAVYGNWKQYQHAKTFETTIEEQQIQLEQAKKERDESNLKLKQRIDKIMDVAGAIRTRYPNVPKGRAIVIADLEITHAKRTNTKLQYGLGISDQESGFDPLAVSYNGTSYGVKQVHYNVWKQMIPSLTMKCLRDVECNIKTGYDILAHYRKMHNGDITRALQSYYGATDRSANEHYASSVKAKARFFVTKLG